MKIHIFMYDLTSSPSTWYGSVIASILNELGHSGGVTTKMTDCFGDDITFLVLWGQFARKKDDRFKIIKGKSKCVILMQTEQIHRKKLWYDGFNLIQPHIDAVVECNTELMDFTKKLSKVPVYSLPMGFHNSMITSNDTPISVPWDVFRVEKNRKDRIIYYKEMNESGIKYFKGIPIKGLKKIGPLVRNSKICLNVHSYGKTSSLSTSRVIGMFMANKGFSLVQKSSHPYFKDGEHLVYFTTPKDMIDKIHYYLKHQKEAREIAENGFKHISTKLRLIDFVDGCLIKIKKDFRLK